MLIIQIDKDILKSSIWPGNNKETTTKFEALIFLLLHIENSKGDHQITIAGLAKEWCWSRHKVRDFIKNLVKEDRITLYQNGSKIYINKVAKDTRKDSQNDTKKDSQIYCKKQWFKHDCGH